MTPTLEDAIQLAATAHCGQADKAGLPYITHPLRVMGMFLQPEEADERIVAVLHDVVEDTDVTLASLTDLGYPARIVDALDAISRCSQETYHDYIERVALNSLATRVKLADLRDNLDERRHSTRSLSDETRRKYRDAAIRLVSICVPVGFYTDGHGNYSPYPTLTCDRQKW